LVVFLRPGERCEYCAAQGIEHVPFGAGHDEQ
jgi:hypothetical protein